MEKIRLSGDRDLRENRPKRLSQKGKKILGQNHVVLSNQSISTPPVQEGGTLTGGGVKRAIVRKGVRKSFNGECDVLFFLFVVF